jgi:hypothetical protein
VEWRWAIIPSSGEQAIDVLVSREDIPRCSACSSHIIAVEPLSSWCSMSKGHIWMYCQQPSGTGVRPSIMLSKSWCTAFRQGGASARLAPSEIVCYSRPAALDKRRQDEADVTALLSQNADTISQEDITYLVRTLLGLAFTREDVEKYQQLILWLNETLDLLGMADRRYQEGEQSQGNPSP